MEFSRAVQYFLRLYWWSLEGTLGCGHVHVSCPYVSIVTVIIILSQLGVSHYKWEEWWII